MDKAFVPQNLWFSSKLQTAVEEKEGWRLKWLWAVPQHTGHELWSQSCRGVSQCAGMCCCSAKGPRLCTSASPELSTSYRNTSKEKMEEELLMLYDSPCVLLPVVPHFSFAFFCLCGSTWLVWNVKPLAAFSGQESPFVLCFFAQHQAQLGSWLTSRTQKYFSYQSVLLPLKFIAKFIPLSLAVKWYSIGTTNQSSAWRKRTSHKRKVLPRIDSSETIPHARGWEWEGACLQCLAGSPS